MCLTRVAVNQLIEENNNPADVKIPLLEGSVKVLVPNFLSLRGTLRRI